MKRTIAVMVVWSVAVLTGSLFAQSNPPAGESYNWHGELVALDESAKTLTVKSSVVGDQAPAEFGRLKEGTRVMLTWSGFDKFADAIREVRVADTKKAGERFTFPADFVSYDATRRYVTFKVGVPESSIAKLKSLKPGQWVTATSPHGSSSMTQPIVMVRPYNEPSTNSD